MISKFAKMVCLSLIFILSLSGCDITFGTESSPTITPKPTVVIEPTETPVPTVFNTFNFGLCNNSFWPVIDGASWTYQVTTEDASGFSETRIDTWTVIDVVESSFGVGGNFIIRRGGEPENGVRATSDTFRCDEKGVYDLSLGQDPVLILPPENDFTVGTTWTYASGPYQTPLNLVNLSQKDISFGNFLVADFDNQGLQMEYWVTRSFAQGIGMIYQQTSDDVHMVRYELIDYQSPIITTTNTIPTNDLVQQPSDWVTYLDDPFDGSNGRWQFSDQSSVYLDRANGWLHFESDSKYDDYAYYPIDEWGLPLMVETRMRLVAGGQGYYLPVIRLYYGSGQDDNIWLTYINDRGWTMYTFTGNHTYAPPSENTWVTVRAIFREDGGEIWAKYDSDTDFTYVGSDYRNVPPIITSIKIWQPWDATMDVDYIIIKYLPAQ